MNMQSNLLRVRFGSGASLRGARVEKDPAIGLGFSKTDRRIALRQNVTRNPKTSLTLGGPAMTRGVVTQKSWVPA